MFIKCLALVLTLMTISPCIARPVRGVYRGKLMDNPHRICEIDFIKIDHNGLRPSRINRIVNVEVRNIQFQLRYLEKFSFVTGDLEFDPKTMRDTIQVGYRLMALEVAMDPAVNFTEPKSYKLIDRFGKITTCDKLKLLNTPQE